MQFGQKKMKAWNLLPTVALEVLMSPFFHSTALLLLGRGSWDGAETISQVVKMDYVYITFRLYLCPHIIKIHENVMFS